MLGTRIMKRKNAKKGDIANKLKMTRADRTNLEEKKVRKKYASKFA